MESQTIPAPQSTDSTREPAELVSDLAYPQACIEASTRRSEKQTVREMPAVRWDRRCTPPVQSLDLAIYIRYVEMLERSGR